MLLAFAFGLRVWGVEHGLPYAYNADENAHFVTRAIGLFGHGWNPQYYVNPPAYTYLAHLLLGVWYGGRAGVSNAFAADPTQIWVLSRVLAAVLGTLAIWLTYLAGARLVDRRVGLLAAGHLHGLVPAGLLLASSRSTTCRRWRRCAWRCGARRASCASGALRDYVWAGVGLGLACATKYTGGIVLCRSWRRPSCSSRRPAARPARRAGSASPARRGAASAFLVANPYAVLNFAAFWNGLTHQSDASGDAAGKLGLTQDNGFLYYLWSFGWGLGWIPLVFAAGGAVRLWFDERAAGRGCSCRRVVLFVLFMGSQERYFGRWLMPVFPFVCILAAYARVRARRLGRAPQAGAEADVRRRRRRRAVRAGLRLLAALGPRHVARRHAQPRRASGWSPTSRRARRSSSSRSCPTCGRRTSATRRR